MQGRIYLLADWGEGNLCIPEPNWVNDEITDRRVLVICGGEISIKSLYQNRRGLYLKDGGKRYFLSDFDAVERTLNLSVWGIDG